MPSKGRKMLSTHLCQSLATRPLAYDEGASSLLQGHSDKLAGTGARLVHDDDDAFI